MAKKKAFIAPVIEDEEMVDYHEDDEDDEARPAAADNAREIPIFANTDGRSTKSIASIKLYQLNNPGAGYKGTIPLNSTLDTIAELFGDGLYNIEACNHKGKMLDTKENVRIAMGRQLNAPEHEARQLQLAHTNKEEVDRVERLATRAADESREQGKNFTQLVVTTAEAAATRERDFLRSVSQQQAEFFTGMMAMQSQGFQQLMTMMQAGHSNTIQALTLVNDKKKPAESEPMQFAQLLMQGIDIGRGFNQPEEQDEPPFWQEVLQNGLSILANAQGGAAPTNKRLPSGRANPAAALPKQQKIILREALQLYKQVRSKGIDPKDVSAILSNIQAEKPTPTHPDEPTSEPEEPDTEDSDEGDDDSEDSDEGDDDDILSDDEESPDSASLSS